MSTSDELKEAMKNAWAGDIVISTSSDTEQATASMVAQAATTIQPAADQMFISTAGLESATAGQIIVSDQEAAVTSGQVVTVTPEQVAALLAAQAAEKERILEAKEKAREQAAVYMQRYRETVAHELAGAYGCVLLSNGTVRYLFPSGNDYYKPDGTLHIVNGSASVDGTVIIFSEVEVEHLIVKDAATIVICEGASIDKLSISGTATKKVVNAGEIKEVAAESNNTIEWVGDFAVNKMGVITQAAAVDLAKAAFGELNVVSGKVQETLEQTSPQSVTCPSTEPVVMPTPTPSSGGDRVDGQPN